jgi:ribosome biogenesis protein YTM1
MAPAAPSAPSLPVVFTTRTAYPLPAQKFMVPASWRRYQLSQLVNKALALTQAVPFDFIVRGEVLRASLADWAREQGVGEVRASFFFFTWTRC